MIDKVHEAISFFSGNFWPVLMMESYSLSHEIIFLFPAIALQAIGFGMLSIVDCGTQDCPYLN